MTLFISKRAFTIVIRGFTFLCLIGLTTASHAASITGQMKADSGLDVYLSESESVLGDRLGGTSGSDGYFLDADIADGVTQYLHIVVRGGSSFIASLELDGQDFLFPNGNFTLSTNATDWTANETGVGMPGSTIVDLGANGTDPREYVFGVARDARFIWTGSGSGDRYFVVSLTPSDNTSAHFVSIDDLNGYVQASGPDPVSREIAGEIFEASVESDKGWLSSDARVELSEEAGNETIEGNVSFEAGDFIISAPDNLPGSVPFPGGTAVQGSLNLSLKGSIRIGVGSKTASVEQARSEIIFDRIRVKVGSEVVIDAEAAIQAEHALGTNNDGTDLQTSSTPGMEFLLPGPETEVDGLFVSEYLLPIDEIITTNSQLIGVGNPFALIVEIDWVAVARSTDGRALTEIDLEVSLPLSGDVFNLPDGATIDSIDASVSDNRYLREESDRLLTKGIFLEVDGVEGDSVSKGFEGWIDVSDFHSSVSRTRNLRRRAGPNWEGLIISKELDRASVKLAEAVTDGKVFDELVLVFNDTASGGNWISYEYRLKDSSAVSYLIDGPEEGNPVESTHFDFSRIDWIYTEYGLDGSASGKIEAWWDLETGTGGSTSSTGDNTPPAIEPVGEVSNDPGTEGSVVLTIADTETLADELVVTISTDRPELLSALELTGGGASRTVSYITSALRSGFANIVATLSDGVDTRSISIPILIDVEMTPYEAYLAAYFSEEETFDPILTAPLSDPDNDGMVTQIEYLLGTNPREYSSPSEAVKIDAGDPDSAVNAFAMNYRRRVDDPNVEGFLWGSENGKDWFRLDDSNPLYEETVQSGDNPLFEEVKVTYTLPQGGKPAFIRFQSTAAF